MTSNHNSATMSTNAALAQSTGIVPYLSPQEIAFLENAASHATLKGDRNGLLIAVLFQVGLRVSELIQITPNHLELFEGQPMLRLMIRGHKQHVMSVPEPLANQLQAYSFQHGLAKNDKFFGLTRQRVWQIVKRAAQDAGIGKRVYPHLLRHSDAIERVRQLRHPQALQGHFGWDSSYMVRRYLSTLQQEEALRINREVRFDY